MHVYVHLYYTKTISYCIYCSVTCFYHLRTYCKQLSMSVIMQHQNRPQENSPKPMRSPLGHQLAFLVLTFLLARWFGAYSSLLLLPAPPPPPPPPPRSLFPCPFVFTPLAARMPLLCVTIELGTYIWQNLV